MNNNRFGRVMVIVFAALVTFLVLRFAAGQWASNHASMLGAVSQDMSTGAPNDFDGKVLYQRAVKAYEQFHWAPEDGNANLADPIERAKWAAEWEHKFDNTADLNTPEGTDRAIRIMRDSLGQRFDYVLGKQETADEHDRAVGELAGIGAPVEMQDQVGILKTLPKGTTVKDAQSKMVLGPGHYLVVAAAPFEGSPAAKVLKEGDLITHVDGTVLDGLTVDQAVARIKGAPGTKVKLTIVRDDDQGKPQEINFEITRAKVDLHVVHTKDMGDGINYIKLDNFEVPYPLPAIRSKPVQEMYNAITKAVAASNEQLKKNGKPGGIILDLRFNPGGDLMAAQLIGEMTLPKGTFMIQRQRMPGTDYVITIEDSFQPDFAMKIVRVPGEAEPQIETVDRHALVLPENMPLVVLVNEWSASAAEITSGMLQANHRATLVGQPTLGKGVGQALVRLPYGRSLHVTNFEFLPGGMKMDWVGVSPEVLVKQAEDKGKTDNQLQAAVQIMKSKIDDAATAETSKSDALKKHKDMFAKQLKQQIDSDKRPVGADQNDTIDPQDDSH